jgi:PilX N-terminal
MKSSARMHQHGAATLVVVLMLFFVVSLVAAYTSRNLIFEQRTSVNQYRSSMAFETADAGMEWAISLLSSGRIQANCTETGALVTDDSFRRRYLNIDSTTGMITARQYGGGLDLKPTCVWTGNAWSCDCPSNGEPGVVAPPGNGLRPAFRLRFTNTNITAPGTIRIEVNACVRFDPDCLNSFGTADVVSEGRAQHSAIFALKSALTTPPAAALTVLGAVPGPGALSAENHDATAGGITIHAGGAVSTASFALQGIPGTPADKTVVEGDGRLAALDPANPANAAYPDRFFASAFGLNAESYRDQPAALRMTCGGGCRAALADLVQRNPDRVIWVEDDLVLDTAGDVGSNLPLGQPVAASIVVNGAVRFNAAGVTIYGVVYSRSGNWQGSGLIVGAAMIEGSLAAAAAPSVRYDGALVAHVRRQHGSFVRLSGQWKDWKQLTP